MYAVEVTELSKHFGKFTAVDRISFAVSSGSIFGFLGPNGAGKSTTIRMLCGILAPSSGQAVVAGFDVGRQPDQVKQQIGYMSQRFSLYEDLTVAENLEFYAGVYGIDRPRQIAVRHRLLRQVGLSGKEELLAGGMPKGWKQRLALACALVHQPPLLFLDEPTSGVDPLSRRHFWELIRSLAQQGTTVFVTTHFMDEAEYCNRIAFIAGGRLASQGSPTELKAAAGAASLEEAFVYYARKVANPE